MSNSVEPIAYGIKQAATALSVSPRYIRNLVDSGRIPSFKLGNRRLILRKDLEDFIQAEYHSQLIH